MTTAADLARQLGAKRTKPGSWMAKCPAHEDSTASLSISEGEDGRLLLHCFAGCEWDAIVKAAGVEPTKPNGEARERPGKAKIVATYDYCDPCGELLFQAVRMAPKDFRQRRPDGNGGWIWNLQGVELVPYRLPDLVNSSEVYVCEGEKDCDRLAKLGLAATTNPMGAGKWPKIFGGWFDGRHVVILPDNDDPGRKHARDIAAKLTGHAASIKMVDLPGLPDKGDVSDWLNQGHDLEELTRIIDAAPYYEPGEQGEGEPDVNALPPITAIGVSEFVNLTITPRRFVMEPWLREKGLAMVHAKTGIGKTWFALSCAHAIATGGRFLRWSAPEPLRVLYLDGEMAAQDTQERLRAIGAGGSFDIVSFDLYDGPVPNLASEEGQVRLAAVIKPADVVFVDNLSCLTFDDGRTDAESWEIVQAWLLSLRRQGKSVVLLHHSGKNGSQRGTSRRGDALDAVIRLERPADAVIEDGCRFTVTFEKARGYMGAAAAPFEAQLRDGQWSMAEEDTGQLMAVADLICEGKPIRKIADQLGMSPTKVHRLKKQAMERGLI